MAARSVRDHVPMHAAAAALSPAHESDLPPSFRDDGEAQKSFKSRGALFRLCCATLSPPPGPAVCPHSLTTGNYPVFAQFIHLTDIQKKKEDELFGPFAGL
jgi:hypothetical protein